MDSKTSGVEEHPVELGLLFQSGSLLVGTRQDGNTGEFFVCILVLISRVATVNKQILLVELGRPVRQPRMSKADGSSSNWHYTDGRGGFSASNPVFQTRRVLRRDAISPRR